MNDPEELLSFWFGDSTTQGAELGPYLSRWFGRDASFDRIVVGTCGAALDQAGRGELEAWKDTARGRLALIILMDQVARNAFRDSPRAFAFDARAVQLCIEGLASGADTELLPVERLFFYLPLLHSERLATMNAASHASAGSRRRHQPRNSNVSVDGSGLLGAATA